MANAENLLPYYSMTYGDMDQRKINSIDRTFFEIQANFSQNSYGTGTFLHFVKSQPNIAK